MKQFIKNIADKAGYQISKKDDTLVKNGIPMDIDDALFLKLYHECKDFSFTTIEPLFSLYQSVRYVIENNIAGDFVECGVWKGGSAMLIAKTLKELGISDRKIYLYDTFEGMSEPTTKDVDFLGNPAKDLLASNSKKEDKNVWCYSSLEEVKKNLHSCGYPTGNIIFVEGKVENTIPQMIPSTIALLRLDTDWFESTYHELVYLYPILVKNGVLIIDDYGHWKGAKDATDQYFKENSIKMLLNRIDYTVRSGIKI
jgi:O-methyltransferase